MENTVNKEVTEIEQNYLDSLQSNKKDNIDFWGINIIDAPEKGLIYKTYCSQKISRNREHPLIEYVNQKGMLRYFADVADSEHPDVTRIDISLYQRNDSNIGGLFGYLKDSVPFFQPHMEDVKKVAEMKITDEPGYKYASLYHVGLIEDKKESELLKFHFFTRWCKNPNKHSKEGYRDEEFLNYLQGIGIAQYQVLAQKAKDILDNCGGHLWMAGMDIAPEKVKYKIYMKNISASYEFLAKIAGENIEEHLRHIKCWNEKHAECRLAGAAVAVDTENVSSLNLYYHVD